MDSGAQPPRAHPPRAQPGAQPEPRAIDHKNRSSIKSRLLTKYNINLKKRTLSEV